MLSVGLVGVGDMGSAILPHLIAAGFAVSAYDIDPSRQQDAETAGAHRARSAADCARQADIVLCPGHVRRHLRCPVRRERRTDRCPPRFGHSDRFHHHARHGPAIQAHAPDGVLLVDAPVVGGVRYAQEQSLTFLAGGEPEAVDKAEAHLFNPQGDVMSDADGIDVFDPNEHRLVPARTFEELEVGEVFRAPGRTVTDAHGSAFQTISADNHPVHYDVEWARAHGHSAPVVHGLQVLAFTAPGATLFPHVIGDVFVRFDSLACRFLGEVHAGDTLYSQLRITELIPQGGEGRVKAAVSVKNQRGELVLDGEHVYVLKRQSA